MNFCVEVNGESFNISNEVAQENINLHQIVGREVGQVTMWDTSFHGQHINPTLIEWFHGALLPENTMDLHIGHHPEGNLKSIRVGNVITLTCCSQ